VQQLLEDAAQHTNVPAITKAVITVPAYFDDEQRDATVAAGGQCQPDAPQNTQLTLSADVGRAGHLQLLPPNTPLSVLTISCCFVLHMLAVDSSTHKEAEHTSAQTTGT
jgi:hypothetical protein